MTEQQINKKAGMLEESVYRLVTNRCRTFIPAPCRFSIIQALFVVMKGLGPDKREVVSTEKGYG